MSDAAILIIGLLVNSVWIVPLLYGGLKAILADKKRSDEYWKKKNTWDKNNPDKKRLLCTKCRYCKKTSSRPFRNGMPIVYPMYCRYLRKDLQSGSFYSTQIRCIVPEPTEEFLENPELENVYPDFKAYYSKQGTCYHSKKDCSSLRNTTTLYWATKDENRSSLYSRRPCPKCCIVADGRVLPK